MTKVVVAKISLKKAGGRPRRRSPKLVRDSNGNQLPLFDVDSNDDNFDDDLTQVFKLNVANARQANTEMFGSPDGPPKPAPKFKRAAQKRK